MASVQAVGAGCVDPTVATEAIDGGLADPEIDRVDGVRNREHAADNAVWSGGDFGGYTGIGKEGRKEGRRCFGKSGPGG